MATIITKNSSTASSVPLAAQLVQGELAVNVTDKRLFTENSGGTVVELGTTPSSLSTGALAYTGTLTGGTGVVNIGSGQVYKDASGNVGIGTSSPTEKLDVSGAISTTSNAANFNQAKTTLDYASGAGRIAAYISTGSNLQFYTNPNAGTVTERMRIDSSGNVGFGTSSPNAKLETLSSTAGAEVSRFEGNYSGSSTVVLSNWRRSGGAVASAMRYNDANNSMEFGTTTSHAQAFITGGTERARIDSSGNLLVGTTSTGLTNANAFAFQPASAGSAYANHVSGSASGNGYLFFGYNGSSIGSITQNGTTGVLYNLTSDYRLKNNPTALTGAQEFVMALHPKTWDWWDGSGKGVGFIAHEFMEVAKYSGHGEKDAVDENGKIVAQSIQPSSSEVMANLVAFIQEQQALITALTTRITALEAK